MVIRTPDQRLRVFVSSTLDELAAERQAVARAISAMRLTPVLFELGARPHRPRELYQAYLAQSEIFIGLYWQQHGQAATELGLSGLEEEFELAQGLPRLLYVKEPAPDRTPRLAQLLARIAQEASYRSFRTPTELRRLVRDDIATLLSERFAAAVPAPAAAPPPPSRSRPRSLPLPTTSLVGREQAIETLTGLLGRHGARLVTLTGPGGIGKTRLATAVGERLHDRFDAGTAFVPLADVTQPESVLTAIGRAVDAGASDTPMQALVERVGDDRWLLILDNLEQVLGVAGELDELLSRCPGVAILATSLVVLRLRAEREFAVPPLSLPADLGGSLDELASSPAVALFVDRARAVRHDFALTGANARLVVEICRLLEGLPLAIELAAARTRLLDTRALLRRLTMSLDALGDGAVDLPARQRTLRATVEWSIGLLGDAERSLLEAAAVFVDGWTVEAAAEVAGLDEDRALDLTESLARHSLISLDFAGQVPRSRMLGTIREFVAERLAARPDVAAIEHRHADFYCALAERADRPLRRGGQGEWAARLEAELGNLAAAVRWYVAHDPAPLPHLYRVLFPIRVLGLFWGLRDDTVGEARPWVEQALPTADALDPRARTELLITAVVTALESGDPAAAVVAADGLTSTRTEIDDDPYLRALSHLATAWAAGRTRDLDRAVREATACLALLRGQDEPLWTAVSLITLGSAETAVRRFDSARRHLTELRDLAERYDYGWFVANSLVLLGALASDEGRPDDARALLDEGLALGVATRSTHTVALALAASARLAYAEGDAERAALLAGAADGVRTRAGVRVWPSVRRETDLSEQLRQALGSARFDDVFADGSRLNQPQAVAAVRDRVG